MLQSSIGAKAQTSMTGHTSTIETAMQIKDKNFADATHRTEELPTVKAAAPIHTQQNEKRPSKPMRHHMTRTDDFGIQSDVLGGSKLFLSEDVAAKLNQNTSKAIGSRKNAQAVNR